MFVALSDGVIIGFVPQGCGRNGLDLGFYRLVAVGDKSRSLFVYS